MFWRHQWLSAWPLCHFPQAQGCTGGRTANDWREGQPVGDERKSDSQNQSHWVRVLHQCFRGTQNSGFKGQISSWKELRQKGNFLEEDRSCRIKGRTPKRQNKTTVCCGNNRPHRLEGPKERGSSHWNGDFQAGGEWVPKEGGWAGHKGQTWFRRATCSLSWLH